MSDSDQTTLDTPAKALYEACEEACPWPPLKNGRAWDELSDGEREHYRALARSVLESVQ